MTRNDRESRRLAGVLPVVPFRDVRRCDAAEPADSRFNVYGESIAAELIACRTPHAGVLLVLALVGLRYMDDANLPARLKMIARSFIPLPATLMPAGFFLSMVNPGATAPNSLIALTYVGAAVLAVGVVTLGIGLLRPDPR